MARKFPAYTSVRKESSLAHYAIRAEKDLCLHNDVEDFVSKRCSSLDALVGKLLNGDFILPRYTDPSYPF